MPNIQAGNLRHYITIQSQGSNRDQYGQAVPIWSALYHCWASVAAITSKELYSIGGFTEQASHKVVIRYPAVSITHGMQVVCGGDTLTIQGVSDPDGLGRELNLYCLGVS